MNRVWHYHFGAGIVDSPNDFGRMGSLPTHPELLDWLAAEFRDRGGSIKQLQRVACCQQGFATERQNAKARVASVPRAACILDSSAEKVGYPKYPMRI